MRQEQLSPEPQNADDESSYLRIYHIIGDKSKGIRPLLPISKSTWWRGIKAGKYPRPLKIGFRVSVWRMEDLIDLLSPDNPVTILDKKPRK